MAVNAAEFFGLFIQQTGQHDASALFGAGCKHFAEHTQRVGEDVGDNYVELPLRQTVGQEELCIDVVLFGVVPAGADGLFVNIHADGGTCTEFEGGDGQDARTAAVVEDAFAVFELRIQPFEAEARGRVAAGAEGESGIEAEVDGSLRGLRAKRG